MISLRLQEGKDLVRQEDAPNRFEELFDSLRRLRFGIGGERIEVSAFDGDMPAPKPDRSHNGPHRAIDRHFGSDDSLFEDRGDAAALRVVREAFLAEAVTD
jgi:hypothetical protein